jgi:hypothetical protein
MPGKKRKNEKYFVQYALLQIESGSAKFYLTSRCFGGLDVERLY